jgi:hypothetical protein
VLESFKRRPCVAMMHRPYEHMSNILSETATASHLAAREALLIIEGNSPSLSKKHLVEV